MRVDQEPRTRLVAAVAVLVLVLLLALWFRGADTGETPTEAEAEPEPGQPARRGSGTMPVSDRSFVIGADAIGRLSPGDSRPVNLSVRNLASFGLSVTGLTVALRAVEAPRADRAHPCGAVDFDVHQLSASYPLLVPARSTADLTGLGIPRDRWPLIEMLDAVWNQDGCKGATLMLAYSAAADRDTP